MIRSHENARGGSSLSLARIFATSFCESIHAQYGTGMVVHGYPWASSASLLGDWSARTDRKSPKILL